MDQIYTAHIRQRGDWWIGGLGWIEEIPGVNCQERTYEELLDTLKVKRSRRLWNWIESKQSAWHSKASTHLNSPVFRHDSVRNVGKRCQSITGIPCICERFFQIPQAFHPKGERPLPENVCKLGARYARELGGESAAEFSVFVIFQCQHCKRPSASSSSGSFPSAPNISGASVRGWCSYSGVSSVNLAIFRVD